MRKYCGLPKANDFSDLNDTLSNAVSKHFDRVSP